MTGQSTFDVKRFIDEQFGGAVPLSEAYPRWPTAQVHKWRQRNSLPGPDLAWLLEIIEVRDGVPFSILGYMQEKTCSTDSKPNPCITGLTSSVFD